MAVFYWPPGVDAKQQWKFNLADALFLVSFFLCIDFVVLLFSGSYMVNKIMPHWWQQ